MLKRKIDDFLLRWKENRKQALLITGARQIGKTFSIENFANNNFENQLFINFSIRTDLIDTFADLKNSDQLLIKLSAIAGEKMIPEKTIIFLDEIQLLYQRREELKKQGKIDSNSQDIITAMKAVVLEGKYRFILSGSLLGVTINDIVLMPTGYMDTIEMYPLDFEEFLWAKGVGNEAIKYVKDCFTFEKEVDESINKLFLDYFEEYVLIGGMPEAVESYFKDKNIHLIQTIQEQIVDKYKYDITTYVKDEEKKLRIREIYNSIPSELNSKNKRFISSHVVEKSYLKNKNLNDEFLWLTNASVSIPVYNVTEATLPLQLASERKTLKLFVNDIGLLDSMLFSTGIRENLLNKKKEINYGAPYENVVAQELKAHGFNEKIFYYNSKKHGEVDFIVEYNNEVLPIEIKSGKPDELKIYNHTALNNLINMYSIDKAFVFGECNVVKETSVITQFPIYMISFIKK